MSKVSNYDEIYELREDEPPKFRTVPLTVHTDIVNKTIEIGYPARKFLLDYDNALALNNAIAAGLEKLKKIMDAEMPKRTKANTAHFGLTEQAENEKRLLGKRMAGSE